MGSGANRQRRAGDLCGMLPAPPESILPPIPGYPACFGGPKQLFAAWRCRGLDLPSPWTPPRVRCVTGAGGAARWDPGSVGSRVFMGDAAGCCTTGSGVRGGHAVLAAGHRCACAGRHGDTGGHGGMAAGQDPPLSTGLLDPGVAEQPFLHVIPPKSLQRRGRGGTLGGRHTAWPAASGQLQRRVTPPPAATPHASLAPTAPTRDLGGQRGRGSPSPRVDPGAAPAPSPSPPARLGLAPSPRIPHP